jgi:hypothetical protein
MQSGASDVHGLSSTHVVPMAGKQTRGVAGSMSWSVQRSPLVQELPSSGHMVPSGRLVCVTPASGVQASSVHGFPSSKLTSVPVHVPLLHVSPLVHGLSSLQVPLSRSEQPPFEHVPHWPQFTHSAPFVPQVASVLDTHRLFWSIQPEQQTAPAAQRPPEQLAPTSSSLQTPSLQVRQVPQALPVVGTHF